MEDKKKERAERIANAFANAFGISALGGFTYVGGLILKFYEYPLFASYMLTLGLIFIVMGVFALIASGFLYLWGFN